VKRIGEALAAGREHRETLLNHRGAHRRPWWNEIYLAPVFDDAGRLVQYIGVQNDVTDRVLAERALLDERERVTDYLQQIEHLAYSDALTGLLNRRRLQELLETTLWEAAANGTGTGLLYLDLDGFKAVNDSLGHAAGDELLREVSARLRRRLRPGDLVARLGGDEFLVLLPGLDPADARAAAQRVADELTRLLAEPVLTTRGPVVVGASIGVSAFPVDGDGFDQLVHAADGRMYAVKKRAARAER